MKSIFTTFLIFLSFFTLPSCSFFQKKAEEKAIAKIGDKVLYAAEIASMIPPGTSEADSVQVVQNYIQTWIRKNLLIEKAELNLTKDQKDVDKQLEEYRTSLIIFTYEKEYIRQHLDTLVSMDEIEHYYNEHKQDFILKDNIYDVAYVKLKKTVLKLDKPKKLFLSNKEEDGLTLEDFCYNNAYDFSLKKENWMSFDLLTKTIPISNEESLNKNNTIIEAKDSIANYLIKVNDLKLKNSISPLKFETENIRNIVVNKRKLKLIEGLENSLYKTAMANGEVEVY